MKRARGFERPELTTFAELSVYYSWRGMLNRCKRENNDNFKYYGAKGITVCDRWSNHNGFENFRADMGPKPLGTSLDRINRLGNYEPSNCKWSTPKEQAVNRLSDVPNKPTNQQTKLIKTK